MDRERCKHCGREKEYKVQRLSVWLYDGPGPCAGTGRVERKVIGWCASCESEPASTGILRSSIAQEIFKEMHS